MYPVNLNVSKYVDIDSSCSFSKQAEESLEHLFFEGPLSKQSWSDLGSHIFDSANDVHSFSLKDIIFYYDNTKNKPLEHTIICFILYSTFFIHKKKGKNSHASYLLFKIKLTFKISSSYKE